MDVTRLYRTPNPAALRPTLAPNPEGGSPVRGLGAGSPRGNGAVTSFQRGLALGRGGEHQTGDMSRVQDPLTVLAAKEAELLRGTGDWHNIQGPVRFAVSLLYQTVTEQAGAQRTFEQRLLDMTEQHGSSLSSVRAEVKELEQRLAAHTASTEEALKSQAVRLQAMEKQLEVRISGIEDRISELRKTLVDLEHEMQAKEAGSKTDTHRRIEEACQRARRDLTQHLQDEAQAMQRRVEGLGEQVARLQADAAGRVREAAEERKLDLNRVHQLDRAVAAQANSISELTQAVARKADSSSMERAMQELTNISALHKAEVMGEVSELKESVSTYISESTNLMQNKVDKSQLDQVSDLKVDGAELARAVWEAQGTVLEAAKSEAQRAMDAGNKELLREVSFAIQQATQAVDAQLREDLVVMLQSAQSFADEKVQAEACVRAREDETKTKQMESSLSNFAAEIEGRLTSLSSRLTTSAVNKARATPSKSSAVVSINHGASSSDNTPHFTRHMLVADMQARDEQRGVVGRSETSMETKAAVGTQQLQQEPSTAALQYKSAAAMLRSLPYKALPTSTPAPLRLQAAPMDTPSHVHRPHNQYQVPTMATMALPSGTANPRMPAFSSFASPLRGQTQPLQAEMNGSLHATNFFQQIRSQQNGMSTPSRFPGSMDP